MSTFDERRATQGPRAPEDFYANNADFYAAIVRPIVAPLNRALAEILACTEGREHPALDVGSGTGIALPALADRGVERLYAVEPSAAMRAGLMAVVASDGDLAQRTTVLPGTLREVERLVPPTLGAITALNVVGHMDRAELAHFWSLVDARLAPGAPVAISLQPPLKPVEVPWTDFGTNRIGDLSYRTEGRASPDGDAMAWTMRWTVATPDGDVLESREATTSWRLTGPDDLARWAEQAGCVPGPSRDDMLLYSFTHR